MLCFPSRWLSIDPQQALCIMGNIRLRADKRVQTHCESRQITKFQPDNVQHKKLRSANRCAWRQAYEAEPLDLSLLDSCSSALARQAQRRTLETGAIRLSLNLFSNTVAAPLNSRKHKLESSLAIFISYSDRGRSRVLACMTTSVGSLCWRWPSQMQGQCQDFISYSKRRKLYFLSHYGKTMIFFALF